MKTSSNFSYVGRSELEALELKKFLLLFWKLKKLIDRVNDLLSLERVR